jgi:hypothetical protein
MRLVLKSAQLSLLIILTVLSCCLCFLFVHHDRLLSVHGSAELRQGGAVLAVIPGLGSVLDLLRQPLPLFVFILLPAFCLVLVEFRHLWRSYARPGYSARLEI